MILGVGLDLCGVERIRDMPSRERFLERYYAPEERAYIAGRGAAGDDSAAACYAAKEAFFKALGTGIREAGLDEVCVLHDDGGAPRLHLTGRAAALARARGVQRMHLSLSHEGGIAAAVVVLEG